MSEQEQVLSHIMELIFAIQNNKIDQAKIHIEYLNEMCNKEEHLQYYNLLQDNNPLNVLGRQFFNNTYIFTANNLNNIINKVDIQWILLLYKIEKDHNLDLFHELIENFIGNSDSQNLKYYIQTLGFNKIKLDLVKLCFFYQDYDSLNKINLTEE